MDFHRLFFIHLYDEPCEHIVTPCIFETKTYDRLSLAGVQAEIQN